MGPPVLMCTTTIFDPRPSQPFKPSTAAQQKLHHMQLSRPSLDYSPSLLMLLPLCVRVVALTVGVFSSVSSSMSPTSSSAAVLTGSV